MTAVIQWMINFIISPTFISRNLNQVHIKYQRLPVMSMKE
jgi:hypothetical protein